jgi:hypothetical protein
MVDSVRRWIRLTGILTRLLCVLAAMAPDQRPRVDMAGAAQTDAPAVPRCPDHRREPVRLRDNPERYACDHDGHSIPRCTAHRRSMVVIVRESAAPGTAGVQKYHCIEGKHDVAPPAT